MLKKNNRPIRVVHISTYHKGGAGASAFRVHNALLKSGVDSHFICLDSHSDNASCSKPPLKTEPLKKNNWFDILAKKIKWRLKHHFNINTQSKRENITRQFKILSPEFKCEIATLHFSNYDILKDPFVQKADIIHLHWVAEIIDYPVFFKQNKKPVVWTLHDMNAFQGIFHYKDDEERNKSIALSIDRKVRTLKRYCIKNNKAPLSIVAPSKWLSGAAKKSKIFKNVNGYCIPYALDTVVFNRRSTEGLRSSLNIPTDHTIFLFVAKRTNNHRKGFDFLIDSLKKINHETITLLIIGNSDYADSHLNIIRLGSINDELNLSNYYSLADAFIIPSREDNLPNVMLESMACGTPVIAFNVGGMAEIIKDGFNGLKAGKINAVELSGVIEKFIRSKETFSSEAIRNFALENFGQKIIARKYEEVYENVLKYNA
jgi:glycosyltransferase involved in cell wall biosynthesis